MINGIISNKTERLFKVFDMAIERSIQGDRHALKVLPFIAEKILDSGREDCKS